MCETSIRVQNVGCCADWASRERLGFVSACLGGLWSRPGLLRSAKIGRGTFACPLDVHMGLTRPVACRRALFLRPGRNGLSNVGLIYTLTIVAPLGCLGQGCLAPIFPLPQMLFMESG